MEETDTNIHIGLVRRNNFLRENPISCEIAVVWGKTPGQRAFRGGFGCSNRDFLGFDPTTSRAKRGGMTEQEPGRSVWASGLH